MAVLTTKSFATLLADFAATVQSSAAALQDFSVGSLNRAYGQALSGIVLWLQGLILKLLKATRLSTAAGSDVDSFVADFGLTRIPPIHASGAETFSRVTPSIATVVPIGALLQSGDGTQSFTVIADASNPYYSSAVNGYPMTIGTLAIVASIQAVNGGTQGNVAIGAISVLQTGIVGVDNVTNAAKLSDGRDKETDAELKTRFSNTIAGLSAGTNAAIVAAVNGTGQGLQITIGNNVDFNGTADNGMVTIIVDDGTGSIPAGLVTVAATAADTVRPAGIRYGVFAASKLIANVTMTISTIPGFNHPTVVGQVAAALAAYINAIGLANPLNITQGNTLPYTRLEAIAYGVAGVSNVTNVSLNGATLDLAATFKQTIKSGSVVVS